MTNDASVRSALRAAEHPALQIWAKSMYIQRGQKAVGWVGALRPTNTKQP